MMPTIKRKWCVQCGRPVDLRRDNKLEKSFAEKMGIKNPEYQFIHKGECNNKLLQDLFAITDTFPQAALEMVTP